MRARSAMLSRMNPMRAMVATALLTALLLAGCGGGDTPERGGPAAADSVGGASVIDRGFVRDMVAHHRSAIEMAQVGRKRGESAFVKDLAGEIIKTQRGEIRAMEEADEALAAERINPGDLGLTEAEKAIEHDAGALATAKPFDPEFLQQMIHHHEGAVRIAQVEQERGNSLDLKNLAENIEETQTREVAMMKQQLGKSGAPAGAEHHGG